MLEIAKEVRENLGDTVCIALLTAAGFVAAYLFQVGFCFIFDIPLAYIRLEIFDITRGLLAIGLSISVYLLALGLPILLFASHPKTASVLGSVFMFLIAGWITSSILSGLVFGGIFGVLIYCVARNFPSYVLGEEGKFGPEEEEKRLYFYRVSMASALFCFTIFFIPFMLGSLVAKKQSSFQVTGTDDNVVLLRRYHDYYVAAPIYNNELTTERYIIPFNEVKDFRLVRIESLADNYKKLKKKHREL